MEAIEIFRNSQLGDIRVVVSETNEPMFCLADVCNLLGLTAKLVNQRLADEVVSNYPIVDSIGRTQQALFINEDGLYDVILDSRKPEAKQFRKWVTSEVLPSIRKHGAYITAPTVESMLDNPDAMIKLLQAVKDERAQRQMLEQQNALQARVIKEVTPKIDYYNEVLSSTSTYITNQIAKELGMSAVTLNQKLKQLGVQYKQHEQWILSAKHQAKGYTKTNTHPYTKNDGTTGTAMQTVWTEKGREFIHQLINQEN